MSSEPESLVPADHVTQYRLMDALKQLYNYDVLCIPASLFASNMWTDGVSNHELEVLDRLKTLDLWGDGTPIRARLTIRDPNRFQQTLKLRCRGHDCDRLTWAQFCRLVHHFAALFRGHASESELLFKEADVQQRRISASEP